MPKIFLIKNQLQQQQAMLLSQSEDAHLTSASDSLEQPLIDFKDHLWQIPSSQTNQNLQLQPAWHLLQTEQKLPLVSKEQPDSIVLKNKNKDNKEIVKQINDVQKELENKLVHPSPSASLNVLTKKPQLIKSSSIPYWKLPPKRRFISTSNWHNITYGSKDNLQKVKLSTVKEDTALNPEEKSKFQISSQPPVPKCYHVSVIQHTNTAVEPAPIYSKKPLIKLHSPVYEPKDAPIDYCIPSKLLSGICDKLSPINGIPFEFDNGSHGIKNNLTNNNVLPLPPIISGITELRSNSATMAFSSDSTFFSPKSTEKHSKNRSEFCCDMCSKSFNYNYLLKHKEQCHSNVKQYILCEFCGKGFYNLYDLKRHNIIHTGVCP